MCQKRIDQPKVTCEDRRALQHLVAHKILCMEFRAVQIPSSQRRDKRLMIDVDCAIASLCLLLVFFDLSFHNWNWMTPKLILSWPNSGR